MVWELTREVETVQCYLSEYVQEALYVSYMNFQLETLTDKMDRLFLYCQDLNDVDIKNTVQNEYIFEDEVEPK